MFSIKSIKTQAVAFSIAGAIALASVMGTDIASADGPGRDSNPSVGRVSFDIGPVGVPQEIIFGQSFRNYMERIQVSERGSGAHPCMPPACIDIDPVPDTPGNLSPNKVRDTNHDGFDIGPVTVPQEIILGESFRNYMERI